MIAAPCRLDEQRYSIKRIATIGERSKRATGKRIELHSNEPVVRTIIAYFTVAACDGRQRARGSMAPKP